MVINFSLFDNNTKEGEIKCKTGNAAAPQEMNILLVRIDELTNLTLSQSFRYFPDPTGIDTFVSSNNFFFFGIRSLKDIYLYKFP
jgi:hypothetical protein